ncbi:DUF4159 domain-containing protein [Sneathiella chinensis]|uniref:LytTR family transcriptional regulator n=1 Tax=Sneathiella chinensis TaxID=349750 RepID=A0ABQ5U5H2_9PROT|nr:DUF4159 domain-containing protein [Sneathiella chinensis]GLQ05726.1 LytTR family transcriptional regulator [Sneathiella chinensis]
MILAFFSSLSFLNPWMLLALAALPALWWLLRLTPPTPRRLRFPPVRLLLQISREEQSAATIPWWLLVLRLLIATLIIVALSRPVLNLPLTSGQTGPAVLLVDNGWTSAPTSEARQTTLNNLIQDFLRQERLIYILPTAARAEGTPLSLRPLSPQEARGFSHAMDIRSWNADRDQHAPLLDQLAALPEPEFFWLSDGISVDDGDETLSAFLAKLTAIGPLTTYLPAERKTLFVIDSPITDPARTVFPIRRLITGPEASGTLVARGNKGQILASKPFVFEEDMGELTVSLTLPNDVRNDISRIEIQSERHAGATYLLDNQWQRKSIGISTGENQGQGQNLLSETHYLSKAMTPFFDLRTGDPETLIQQKVSLIALGDTATLNEGTEARLENWISSGGVLIRFAGPKLANARSSLTPVDLRTGNRTLDGSMSWSDVATLGPFPENSPFSGIEADRNIKVQRQILANPSPDLGEKTWAQLEDGTPLVTADRRGKGWIVLFHTTATTAWSDLVLSGTFVEMLREIGQLGSFENRNAGDFKDLPPLQVLDGRGTLTADVGLAKPLTSARDALPPLSADHPPGYYGTADYRVALNVSPRIRSARLLDPATIPGVKKPYQSGSTRHLGPLLLVGILLLVLADCLASLHLQGRLPSLTSRRIAPVLLVLGLAVPAFMPGTAKAEETLDRLLEATLETRLAYVTTGDRTVDTMSRAGLEGLSDKLRRRTAVEAASPLAIDIEENELLFFPLVYWPVTLDFPALSDKAIARINSYLKGGGTILFDTRNQYSVGIPDGSGLGSAENRKLAEMLGNLNIPRLVPIAPDHVLTRSFYLMQTFPGRYSDGQLWVEDTSGTAGNDGVASVIIGSNDWAAAWAEGPDRRPLAAVIPGMERQREFAFRFGINLVMYTLAGNYKADQVHVPAILERLGQ